ncbi:MAG TPA: phytanoyl-CoA dioxygenase family protein [Planctomycetota bacterium]|nr:phytanoyl-CoA dioxygenase family protein [Planctomycetota bacterium]
MSHPEQIDQDYPLTQEQIDFYRKNGFIQLNDVVTGEALAALREAVAAAVKDEGIPDNQANKTRSSYEALFIQKVNLWQRHAAVKPFSLCRRFGNLAARLAGRPMRIWHDQALFKEPEVGARTPWHQDTHYWPHREKKDQLSIWIALKDVDTRNGCMSFLPGTHQYDKIPPINLGNPQDIFELEPRLKGIKPATCPMKAGSVTFHNGLTFHYAGPNKSDSMREAFAILYMPDGTTFSGWRHVVTNDENSKLNEPLCGKDFPMVSDAVFEEQMATA